MGILTERDKMSLQLSGKRFLVFGVANKKSVAYQTALVLEQAGAEVVYSVRSEQRREQLTSKLLAGRTVLVCDVEREEEIARLAEQTAEMQKPLDGILHSVAFAEYEGGNEAVPRNDEVSVFAGDGYFLLLAHRHRQRVPSPVNA